MLVQIPNNWVPRDYQRPAWDYLENGGKHAELIWHRRSGKDEITLHRTCVAAHERVATYWHMLPLAAQARKAIWEAINPHTGKRRIDEAFPPQLRSATRSQDMFIKFKNGSTWQVLGSDNYEGSIGSPPAGIVYSEWAQAKPAARAFLRPILAENNGWQVFITTPRGKNHAYKTHRAAKKTKGAFTETLRADQTSVFSPEQLVIERQAYIDEWGISMGEAYFEQEYMVSFDAAILGAVWGAELAVLQKEGRYYDFKHNPDHPVYVAMDIGRTDATAIWWYQVIANEIRLIDYLADNFKDVDYYASQMLGKAVNIDIVNGQIKVGDGVWDRSWPSASHRIEYNYEKISLPPDAKAKNLATKKSVEEQFQAVFGWGKVRVLKPMSKTDGIKYVRQMLKKTYISTRCDDGFEACKAYEYEWDEKKSRFRDEPLHNWASDPADGLRYVGMAWQTFVPQKPYVEDNVIDMWGRKQETNSWRTM